MTGGLPEFGGPTGSFRRIVQTPGGISIFYDVGQGQGWQRNIVMDGSPHLPSHHPPVVRQLAWSLGRRHARHRCVELQSEDRFSGGEGELAPGGAVDANGTRFARIRGDSRRFQRVDAAMDRQTRLHQAERPREQRSITSRVASRGTSVFPACCMDGASKSSPLRRDGVQIRPPETTHMEVLCWRRIRCGDRRKWRRLTPCFLRPEHQSEVRLVCDRNVPFEMLIAHRATARSLPADLRGREHTR